jgi:hypothetical protein
MTFRYAPGRLTRNRQGERTTVRSSGNWRGFRLGGAYATPGYSPAMSLAMMLPAGSGVDPTDPNVYGRWPGALPGLGLLSVEVHWRDLCPTIPANPLAPTVSDLDAAVRSALDEGLFHQAHLSPQPFQVRLRLIYDLPDWTLNGTAPAGATAGSFMGLDDPVVGSTAPLRWRATWDPDLRAWGNGYTSALWSWLSEPCPHTDGRHTAPHARAFHVRNAVPSLAIINEGSTEIIRGYEGGVALDAGAPLSVARGPSALSWTVDVSGGTPTYLQAALTAVGGTSGTYYFVGQVHDPADPPAADDARARYEVVFFSGLSKSGNIITLNVANGTVTGSGTNGRGWANTQAGTWQGKTWPIGSVVCFFDPAGTKYAGVPGLTGSAILLAAEDWSGTRTGVWPLLAHNYEGWRRLRYTYAANNGSLPRLYRNAEGVPVLSMTGGSVATEAGALEVLAAAHALEYRHLHSVAPEYVHLGLFGGKILDSDTSWNNGGSAIPTARLGMDVGPADLTGNAAAPAPGWNVYSVEQLVLDYLSLWEPGTIARPLGNRVITFGITSMGAAGYASTTSAYTTPGGSVKFVNDAVRLIDTWKARGMALGFQSKSNTVVPNGGAFILGALDLFRRWQPDFFEFASTRTINNLGKVYEANGSTTAVNPGAEATTSLSPAGVAPYIYSGSAGAIGQHIEALIGRRFTGFGTTSPVTSDATLATTNLASVLRAIAATLV